MDVSSFPPLTPETILDLVQAAGAHTSEHEGQRELAKLLFKWFFSDQLDRFKDDPTASAYLRGILICAACAIRGFSVERTAFKAARGKEQKIEDARIMLLERVALYSPAGGEKSRVPYGIFLKAVGLSLGAVPLYFIKDQVSDLMTTLLRVAFFLLAVAGFLFLDILTTIAVLALKRWGFRKTGQDVQEVWAKSFPRYKALAVDLLVSADRLRERYYPQSPGLLPGIEWQSIPPGRLSEFLGTPNEHLDMQTPAAVLSRVVDLHFSLDRAVESRYVRPRNTT